MVSQSDAPAPDEAAFLQVLDAPPARGGGQAHLFGDRTGGDGRILLQECEDVAIDSVHGMKS